MKVSLLISAFGSFLPLCFAGDTLDYAKDVLPIMKEHCWKCHSKEHEVKGSLALDDLDGVREDQIGKYNIIRPGDPGESGFVERLKLDSGHTDFMPRKGTPLSTNEIEIIEKWVLSGAIIDASKMTAGEQEWLVANEGAPTPASEEFHQWTNSQGKTIEAKFVSISGKNLKIRKKDDSIYVIDLEKLSAESIALAESLGKK